MLNNKRVLNFKFDTVLHKHGAKSLCWIPINRMSSRIRTFHPHPWCQKHRQADWKCHSAGTAARDRLAGSRPVQDGSPTNIPFDFERFFFKHDEKAVGDLRHMSTHFFLQKNRSKKNKQNGQRKKTKQFRTLSLSIQWLESGGATFHPLDQSTWLWMISIAQEPKFTHAELWVVWMFLMFYFPSGFYWLIYQNGQNGSCSCYCMLYSECFIVVWKTQILLFAKFKH